MTRVVRESNIVSGFRAEVERAAGTRITDCYQCGKCAAGCPMAAEMDYVPSRIMRMIQLGLRDEVLTSRTIWLCASCQTCTTRCPKEVDIAAVMDACREISLREGRASREAYDILAFHRAFLRMIRHYGRLYEFRLVGEYKMKTWHLFQDATVAPVMFFKGKLRLLPDKIEGVEAVRAIFEKCGL